MNMAIEIKRRQWLWLAGLWCIGPVCMLLLDIMIKMFFFIGMPHP
jgi:hypothetical protein